MPQKLLLKTLLISSTKLSSSKWKILPQHALIPSISYSPTHLSRFCAKWDHSTVAHTCCIIDCFDIKRSRTAPHITSSLRPWECDLWVPSLPELSQKSTALVLTRNATTVSGFKWIPWFSWPSKNILWNSSLRPYFPWREASTTSMAEIIWT